MGLAWKFLASSWETKIQGQEMKCLFLYYGFDCLGLNRPILGSLNNNRFFTKSSSETQGQTVGTRESPNGQKNMQRRKVKNGAIWNPTKGFFESLIFSPFFTFLRATFFRPFRLSLVPTICPWVSEDVTKWIVLGKREWCHSLLF